MSRLLVSKNVLALHPGCSDPRQTTSAVSNILQQVRLNRKVLNKNGEIMYQRIQGMTGMTETFDELMAVYEGREGRGVVFQPRIKHWYDVNLAAGTLPKKYQGMYVDEVYQDLGVTPREVWGPGGAGSEFAGYL
ncbi:hypothetical protein AC480_04985, partial [miscellaneous Crenarchaeota group archaeon SMTZ1-55]